MYPALRTFLQDCHQNVFVFLLFCITFDWPPNKVPAWARRGPHAVRRPGQVAAPARGGQRDGSQGTKSCSQCRATKN